MAEREPKKIKVAGETIILEPIDLEIVDIDKEMDTAAALIAYWGERWSEAEEEAMKVEGAFKHWKAVFGESLLKADEKLSEWKARQAIEADPKFRQLSDAFAISTSNALCLKTRVEALKAKASLLQSKGAMQRAVYEATGMSTREKRKEVTREETRDKARVFGKKERVVDD